MKVVLLVCRRYQGSRVSTTTCAQRSKRTEGTACDGCPIGTAAAAGAPLPETWPEGGAVETVPVRVHGTLLGTGAIPTRGVPKGPGFPGPSAPWKKKKRRG